MPDAMRRTSAGFERVDTEKLAIQRQAEFVAHIMDTLFVIPGTSIRVGLDPILGLIPGLGDAVAGLIGSSILFLAMQLGVPKIVQVRMGVNILLNSLIGAIPGLGDLFSLYFQSNVRNARLLRQYSSTMAAGRRPSTLGDWLFVLGVIAVLCAAIAGVFWGLLALAQYVARQF